MPHSLVLNLLPESPIPPGFTSGKHLHALFLNLVSSIDREMGDALHANERNKAFTLSPLQVPQALRSKPYLQQSKIKSQNANQNANQNAKRNSTLLTWHYTQPIAPGTPCWWRISLLDDRLFSRLTPLWLNLNSPQPWHLGPANLHIVSIQGTPQSGQPWANFCPYAQLYEQASDTDRKLTLQFYTPTAFRQGKYDTALPTPDRVFSSLLRRWNHYSGLEFPPDIVTVLQTSYFDIHTEIVTDPRAQFQPTAATVNASNQFIGCVGKVTYQVLDRVAGQTLKQINALADFALYAGVGRKTPMGMGMAKREQAAKLPS